MKSSTPDPTRTAADVLADYPTTASSSPTSSRRCTRATSSRSTSSTSRCAAGEIFGLLGPNGAGKTTTAADAHDPRHPDERTGDRRRRRRRRAPDGREAAHRRRVADEHSRPLAVGVREPLLPRSLLRDERAHRARRDEARCSSSSGSSDRANVPCWRCRAAWRSG